MSKRNSLNRYAAAAWISAAAVLWGCSAEAGPTDLDKEFTPPVEANREGRETEDSGAGRDRLKKEPQTEKAFEENEPQIKAGEPFENGDNEFELGEYSLEEQGLAGIFSILRGRTAFPEKAAVMSFEAKIDENTQVSHFYLILNGYRRDNSFAGRYEFQYNADSKNLFYAGPDYEGSYQEEILYNENSEIYYLDGQIKRLPLRDQIGKLDFSGYSVCYRSWVTLSEGTPVIDGQAGQDIPVLTMEEYRSGQGGTSDGHKAVTVYLYDGSGMTTEDIIYYRLTPADLESLYGDRDFTMKQDYRILDGVLTLTRDYGETWEEVDLSEGRIKETLEFYRSSYTIPEGSYHISPGKEGPDAFFFGEEPVLRIRKRGSGEWKDVRFVQMIGTAGVDFYKPFTRRVVGFTDGKEGYAAIGTDWSMGTGESKTAFYTHDGGDTWEEKGLPESGTSNTLTGMSFMEGGRGTLSLLSLSSDMPDLYCTEDGGDTWEKITLPYDRVMEEGTDRLRRVEGLTFEDGYYILVLGQEDDSRVKVSFRSRDLKGTWELNEIYRYTVHTVG